jgi:hemerythrin superfamily protein
MLERLLLPDTHAIAILLRDHDRVKALFDEFEKAKSSARKESIIAQAVTELKIHATLEEEIFYPAVRAHVGKDLMNEADEEHHVARVLIAELDHGRPSDDHRMAKFTVLSESVRHHIKEEEGEVLPKAKELDIDFEALGQRMLERKERLKQDGIPADREHVMVAAVPAGGGDTPATAARRSSAAAARKRAGRKTPKTRTRPSHRARTRGSRKNA